MSLLRVVPITACVLIIGHADAAQLRQQSSVTMPIFGERQYITRVWKSPESHLVFEFFYRNGSHAFTDFFDTRTGKRLFPDRAEEMANSPGGALQDILRPKELLRVKTSLFSLEGPHYIVRSGPYEGGSLCQIQYSSPLEITTDILTLYRFVIYSRLPSPRKFSSPCTTTDASLNYEEVSVQFVAADKSGFWVLLPHQSAMVRFNWKGQSSYFSGRADPVLVPYKAIDQARKHVEDRGPTQSEYAKAEDVIRSYSRRQLSGAWAISATSR